MIDKVKCKKCGNTIPKKCGFCPACGKSFFFSELSLWQKVVYIAGIIPLFSLIPLLLFVILHLRKKNIYGFVYTLGRCCLFLGLAFFLFALIGVERYILIFLMSIFWIIVWIASYANANRETLADGVPKATITDKIIITVSLLVLLLIIGLIVYGEVSYYLSDKYECESICKKEGFDDYDVDYRDDTPNICICSDKQGNVKEISLG